MIAFPNCKINLGLQVIARRNDGFHEIRTVFYPLGLTDCLEIIPSQNESTTFTSTGIIIPDDGSKNLCEKAWEQMHENHNIPPVDIFLHKAIPIGAGLGGGSADAAFTLQLLNSLFQLNLTKDKLAEYAASLGSDCPFFIHNTPSIARGRGEILEPVYPNLTGYILLLVMPPVHVSTKEAFAGITPSAPAHDLKQIAEQSPDSWQGRLLNDFEPGIFSKYPVIESIKTKLLEMGAIYASMSGSGAAVYGIFDKAEEVSNWQQHFPGCFCWKQKL